MAISDPIDFLKFVPANAQSDFEEWSARNTASAKKVELETVTAVAKVFRLRDEIASRLAGGSLHETEARRVVREWWASHKTVRPLLLLLGNTGAGKTVAVAELATQTPYLYLQSARGARLASDFGKQRVEFEEQLDTRCLLVVDEVGFARDIDREVSFVHEVVDARKSSRTPTVLISNLSADDFKSRFDERTVDRLREYGHVRTLNAASMRGRQ